MDVGTKIELEHKSTFHKIRKMCKSGKCPSDLAMAKMISSNHLAENKNYYKKLIKAKL